MIKIGEGETAEVFKLDTGKIVKLFKDEFYDEDEFRVEFETAKYVGGQTEKNWNIMPIFLERLIENFMKGLQFIVEYPHLQKTVFFI